MRQTNRREASRKNTEKFNTYLVIFKGRSALNNFNPALETRGIYIRTSDYCQKTMKTTPILTEVEKQVITMSLIEEEQ